MKITNLSEKYQSSFNVLNDMLGLQKFDIEMLFTEEDRMCVGVKDGKGYIKCKEIHHMNRLLALFAEYYKGVDFEISERSSEGSLPQFVKLS